jgi:hypothetical protein
MARSAAAVGGGPLRPVTEWIASRREGTEPVPGVNHPVGTASGRTSRAPPPWMPSVRAVIGSRLRTVIGTGSELAVSAAAQPAGCGRV